MRSLAGLYLVIGLALLLAGLFATRDCPDKNRDIESKLVFVLAWPVFLYSDVLQSSEPVPEWLYRRACQGGIVAHRPAITR